MVVITTAGVLAEGEGATVLKRTGCGSSSITFGGVIDSIGYCWKVHNVLSGGETVLYVGSYQGWQTGVSVSTGELLYQKEWKSDFHVVYDYFAGEYKIRQERITETKRTVSSTTGISTWKYLMTFSGGEIRVRHVWVDGERFD